MNIPAGHDMKPMKTKQRRRHFLSSGKTFAKGASLQSRRFVITSEHRVKRGQTRCDAEGRSSFFLRGQITGLLRRPEGRTRAFIWFPAFLLVVQPSTTSFPVPSARQMALVIWPWPGIGWICDVKMSKILGHFARAEK